MQRKRHVLIISKYRVSGEALATYLDESDSLDQVLFRVCLSDEDLPEDFRSSVIILNCAHECPCGVASIRTLFPFAKCIVIARSASVAQQIAWLQSGAHGIVDETLDVDRDTLVRAVKAVMEGDLWAPRSILSAFVSGVADQAEDHSGDLTAREREILNLVSLGLSNSAVAARLRLSEKTVKGHLTKIFRKLDVKNRTQAILKMSRLQKAELDSLSRVCLRSENASGLI